MSSRAKIRIFGTLIVALMVLGIEANAATINVPADHATIQTAINAATAGDTINIAAGTYAESLTIGKNLTLQGATPASYSTSSQLLVDGILSTIIAPATTTDPAIEITSTFTSLTVRNIKISGTTGGSSFKLSFTGAASNLTIDNVAIDGGVRGLSYNSGTQPELTNLVVSDSAFRCSAVTATGLEIWFVDSGFTLDNNYIINCRDGINISSGHGGIGLPLAGENTITNNFIGAVGDSSIQVASPISDLTISNNTISSGGSLEAGNGEGVQITSNGTATNISITGNTFDSGERAIVMETLANTGTTIDITGNTITDNSVVGVLVAGTVSTSNVSGIIVNNNVISGNTAGLQNNVAATTLDATDNYWGSSTGPTHASNADGAGDTSTDNVDYDPWYIDENKTISSDAVSGGELTVASGNLTLSEDSDGEITLFAGVTSVTLPAAGYLNMSAGVNSVSSGQLTLAGALKTLSSFSAGDLSAVDISSGVTVGGASISIGKGVQISSGTASSPLVIKNSALPNVQMSIPDDTALLSSAGWDGILNPPAAVTPDTSSLSGYTVANAYSFGSDDSVIISTKPFELILSGATGDVAYQLAGDTVWHTITDQCAGTYASPTSPSFPGECYITDSGLTKVVAYHLTTYAVLNEVAEEISSRKRSINYKQSDGTYSSTKPQLAFPAYLFTQSLRIGQTSSAVKELQTFLKAQGEQVYPEGLITGYFGPLTRQAVTRFQELYFADILAPLNLKKGTGFAGPSTIKHINKILTGS